MAKLLKSNEEFVRLCSKGSLKQALQGFLPNLYSDPNLFSHLLQGCCIPKQSLPQAQQLHAFIITSGTSSDRFTSNHLLHMYSKLGRLQTASAVFSRMPRKNVMSHNILIGGFIRNDDLETARKVFDEMPERNLASWNAMVTGMTHFGLDEEGLELFANMRKEGFRPDEFSLASALRCSAGLRDLSSGRQIHSCIIQSGFEYDLCVGSSLAHMYMKCGCLEEGESVLKGMPILNVVSSNTIIAGRVQNGDSEGAIAHFHLMKAAGLAPDEVTFVGVISSCSDLAFLSQGQQVHAQVIKAGADSVVPVRSSLVSMYSRCGCLRDSAQVFYDSDESDFVLWSSMIAAYGFHGHGQEAVELFEKMVRRGTKPTEVTFLSLLYACSHSGLKDKGMEYFNLMKQKYGLEPSLKHYTCIVDLLGRSGCLEEAEAMIRSMPHRADGVIWKTLLSACKTHKNVEMAESVAEHVLRLDTQAPFSPFFLSWFS
nr:pentatricopeptide repeat protein AaPPR1260 [Agave angustifolia]